MDPTIANLLAQAAANGGNIFVINCNYGEGGDKGEGCAMEPVEGPGMDGTAAHEEAEGETQPAKASKPQPAKTASKPGPGYRTER